MFQHHLHVQLKYVTKSAGQQPAKVPRGPPASMDSSSLDSPIMMDQRLLRTILWFHAFYLKIKTYSLIIKLFFWIMLNVSIDNDWKTARSEATLDEIGYK